MMRHILTINQGIDDIKEKSIDDASHDSDDM